MSWGVAKGRPKPQFRYEKIKHEKVVCFASPCLSAQPVINVQTGAENRAMSDNLQKFWQVLQVQTPGWFLS